MNRKKNDFPSITLHKDFSFIRDISFTSREIEVIACLVNARSTFKIASLLIISPKTVGNHIHNIMVKIRCNSREGIIDFIEKSGKLVILRQYYLSLLTQDAFRKILNNISTLYRGKHSSGRLICWPVHNHKNTVLSHLQLHLQLAKIDIAVELWDKPPPFSGLGCDLKIGELSEPKEEIEEHASILKEKVDLSVSPALFCLFLPEKEQHNQAFQEFCSYDFLDAQAQKSYYHSFFEILKALFPDVSLEKLIADFMQEYEIIHNADDHFPISLPREKLKDKKNVFYKERIISKKQKSFLTIVFFMIIFLPFSFLFFNKRMPGEPSIRSDLVIPSTPFLLERLEFIAKLEAQFRRQKGIQTVAITGPGGSGKTTLARQYAKQQEASIIWEINSESIENLKGAFENLANALSKTEDEKMTLKNLQTIKNHKEKEEKIICLVKDHLKAAPNWILIYDNVEKFTDIQKYFPQDAMTWGQGRVILTTQDQNIQNNKHIDSNIVIGELAPEQKLDLFTKIINHGKTHFHQSKQRKEAKQFLESLPPFPLDISIAAYYLKVTNISYENYLEKLEKNRNDFDKMQEKLLKESGEYVKTRYSIISMALQRIINTHKDFKALLLFISRLNSQNVPRDLLNLYKGSDIANEFIYSLKKYSMIIDEKIIHPLGITFSLHPSTQTIILAYLRQYSKIQGNYDIETTDAFEKYLSQAIDQEDHLKMNFLIPHCERFLTTSIEEKTRNIIECKLGIIYYELGHYNKAKQTIEEGLQIIKKHHGSKKVLIAETLLYLGRIHKELGNLEKAKDIMEKAFFIYKSSKPLNPIKMARILSYLGNAHRVLGNYIKAKTLLEESLSFYKNYGVESKAGWARSLSYLANVHRELGNYSEAKSLLEESLTLHKGQSPELNTDFPLALAYLGNVYRELGDYKRAKTLLEESLFLYKKYAPENYAGNARTAVYLGTVVRNMGDYKKAIDIFDQALKTYKRYLPPNHPRIAWAQAHLGNAYRKAGDYKRAQELLEESVLAYENSLGDRHVTVAWARAHLGDLYRLLKEYKKSQTLLESGLQIYKAHFTEDHIEIAWIESLLGKLYSELKEYKKAYFLLNKGLFLYKRNYNENHNLIAKTLKKIGKVYFSEEKIEDAEISFQKALKIFEKSNHPDIYAVLEGLSDCYVKKSIQAFNKGETKSSQSLREKSIAYLKKALEYLQIYFPKTSVHTLRVQNKLIELQASLPSYTTFFIFQTKNLQREGENNVKFFWLY